MTVHFIGAGPGSPDLITVRGRDLIRQCPVCLYAGSLVPRELIDEAPPRARIMDTSSMVLDEIVSEMEQANAADLDVARVHSGDPTIYGATAEQARRLDALGIAYDITPGVPAFCAASAALGLQLTVPGIAQTVILTRTAMKASAMPPGEDLAELARSRATLAIHLSIRNIPFIKRALIPHYGKDCPVVVAYRVGWPDQKFITGTLSDIHEKVRAEKITRTALILAGPALAAAEYIDSSLYDPSHVHVLRPKSKLTGTQR